MKVHRWLKSRAQPTTTEADSTPELRAGRTPPPPPFNPSRSVESLDDLRILGLSRSTLQLERRREFSPCNSEARYSRHVSPETTKAALNTWTRRAYGLRPSPSTEKSVGSRAHLPILCAFDVVRELQALTPMSMYSVHCSHKEGGAEGEPRPFTRDYPSNNQATPHGIRIPRGTNTAREKRNTKKSTRSLEWSRRWIR